MQDGNAVCDLLVVLGVLLVVVGVVGKLIWLISNFI